MDYNKRSLELHRELAGKLEISLKMPVNDKDALSLLYTPGVAEPCRRIHDHPEEIYDYTAKGNLVAVVTDGSAVLGLGNIGAPAGLPVMEGKCILFKAFGGVDAVPVCLETSDPEDLIRTTRLMASVYGGINLEDISAPRCFHIERRLKESLDIPVFHDDQHGTAIVTLAALMNAVQATGRSRESLKVAVSGAGAAGVAIADILIAWGVEDVVLCDSRGVLSLDRDLSREKRAVAERTNPTRIRGTLIDAVVDRDVFIGVSAPHIITSNEIASMNDDPIVFAMSNPVPEIDPDDARIGGAAVIATGRSDYPNQINNVLAFPGIFRGALDVRAREINEPMKVAVAEAIAGLVDDAAVSNGTVIPPPFDRRVAFEAAVATARTAVQTGSARMALSDEEIRAKVALRLPADP